MLGGTEPFGTVWRLGANETTEIKLFRDVTFGDKVVKAGTYSLYAIPNATEWTIIFNSDEGQWGSFSYDSKKDVLRVKAKAEWLAASSAVGNGCRAEIRVAQGQGAAA